ncbi:cell division protein FtsA [Paracoccus sp. 1_MG-2023]|uniref:cell division protein FtsA n=1 Tax=unclassified Paracoccus (in: a-proteobacteria) TaxID=2688777 RepID=UPI001C0A230E|nr:MULTISPECIES: cell division protein FtsA [unclassified Paracoccus (in: a-proteobacteria)]MBU2959028.1 cell division protein FtsA [Paracoccus sp. C2R09]MDO6669001.1 cell division protein FtsA [Paracoccus sp. 1_MG-2023]
MAELYQTQRAMRNMRRAALQRGVIGILDIGTSKIACLVLRFDGTGTFRETDGVGPMAGQVNFRVIGAASTRSRGMRRGEIETMAETERAIRTVVAAAQKLAGVRIDHVIACLSGGRPASYGLAGETPLAQGKVDDHDVAKVLAACDVPDFGRGREVLHAQPVNFAVDNRSGLADPREHLGNKLFCDMHVLTVDGDVIGNLVHCIRRCDLELAGIASAPYASARASLVEDEQELGAACIDFGGGGTGVSIFVRKHMIFSDHVPIGGNLITQDIAQGLRVSLPVAERLKTLSGGVEATGRDDRDMIDIGGDTGDWEADRRQVSRADVIAIMRPRVEEILEGVREILDAAGFDYMPSQQMVLTGGGSQIPGLDGLASRILGPNIRCGRPLRIDGLSHQLTDPSFSSAVGLALFAAHPQDEWWDFETPADAYPARSFKRAYRWFKSNW